MNTDLLKEKIRQHFNMADPEKLIADFQAMGYEFIESHPSAPTQVEDAAKEYTERVCNGEFPIEYTREQVVKHTAGDFKAGASWQSAKHEDWISVEKAEELWDDYSVLVGTDIDELQEFAGTVVMKKEHFKKMMAKLSQPPSTK